MKKAFLWGAVVGLMVIAACSSSNVTRPAWVDKPGGIYSGDRGKAFYAAGVASNIQNVASRRTIAETDARTKLARVFQTHIKDLVKKAWLYRSEGGVEVRISEEEFASEATKGFTDMKLTGSIILEYYYDSEEKTQYAYATLDVQGFRDELSRMKALSAEAKDIIERNAQKLFDELEEEATKSKTGQ